MCVYVCVCVYVWVCEALLSKVVEATPQVVLDTLPQVRETFDYLSLLPHQPAIELLSAILVSRPALVRAAAVSRKLLI